MRSGRGASGLPAVAAAMLCLCCAPVTARNIQWLCDEPGAKQFSDGTALDGGMRFELGVFTVGFTPTAANRSEWAAHWVAAQRVDYYPPNEVFSGTVTVEENVAPFTVGKRGYIWGFTDDLENGEWILAGDPAWSWPAPDPFNPIDLFWNIGLAGEVEAGSVNPSGSPFLLRTEAVATSVPPLTTWAQWQAEELSGEPENGPGDDPDGDGRSNLEEYAAGTPPLLPLPHATVRPIVVTVGPDRHLAIMVPLRADRKVVLEIGVSGNLVSWNYEPAATVKVGETSSTVTYRSADPVDGQSRQFLRARFTLPE